MSPDLRLYGILDPAQCGRRDLVALAHDALKGGMTLIQVRDKSAQTRTFCEITRALVAALDGSGVSVIVNDRIDVAMAAGAHGVHVGQDDMPPRDAHALLGPDRILGVTIRTEDEARNTDLAGVSYAGIGGVFPTASKVNETSPVGLDGLSNLAAIVRKRKPGIGIVAIAGINLENAASVIDAKADGIAVISALFGAADVAKAAEDLRCVVDERLRMSAAS